MSSYNTDQTFQELSWATALPVVVFIDSNLERFKARGIFSVLVTEPELLAENIPDPQELPVHLGNLLASLVPDVLREVGASVYTVDEMKASGADISADLGAKVEYHLASLGLNLAGLEVHSVESL